ncbi:TiaS agmantine-binding domain-containing protein [Sulfolobus acidocaldarius]|uniref:TiaS agmantine-binding domain-containing protein n=1 Tax=Sulfolobus acidocaldarius TaxID=2285 RepID=UPI003B846E83
MDDHDSPEAGCTTHFSALLIKHLIKDKSLKILDLPYLIRLNPNIPWKTRGNASIKIILSAEKNLEELAEIIWSESVDYVEKISKATKYNRKPGLAIIKRDEYEECKNFLYNFYQKAVKDIVPLDYATRISKKCHILTKGDRGIIGSIAAIGYLPIEGFTYELITYRHDASSFRIVDVNSVIKFEERNFPKTFNNFDYIKKRLLITPQGKDPILYGVRGNNLSVMLEALKEIRSSNNVELAMIYKSNQGTDAHISNDSKEYYYRTVKKKIKVKDVRILEGGDVLLSSDKGEIFIFYKETGELNLASKFLINGDEIEIIATVRPSDKYGKIFEAERMRVLSLNYHEYTNPKCPKCNRSATSLGVKKGYKCKKCGYEFNAEKVTIEIPRFLVKDEYQSRYHRHLTKPVYLELQTQEDLDLVELGNILNTLTS